jgi:hypothetical protein
MSIIGWYYLHANGSLIYKPHVDAAADIRDSDLARCMWPMDPADRKGAWDICVEGLALGADSTRVAELATKWGCDDVDADRYASVVGIRVQLDGNQWCATGLNFINLQESPAGFGNTKLQAMAALAKSMKLGAGKMWRTTFADLLQMKQVAA